MKLLSMQSLGPPGCACARALRPAHAVPVLLFLALLLLAPPTRGQTPPTLMQQVTSREIGIHVGGVQTPEFKEIVSREVGVFVGEEPVPPWSQATSREASVVVCTPAVPDRVSPLEVTFTPTGETVTLSWTGYNQWAQADVARYLIYMSTRTFTNVSAMTPIAWVPGETFTITFTNLAAWEDRFFAVVAVDAAGGLDTVVDAAGAYVIAKEATSREVAVYVGEEPPLPLAQAASRELSIVVATPELPAAVTSLRATPTPTGDTVALTWSGYNQWAQADVARYIIYMSTRISTNLSAMTPIAWVPAETFALTLTNLPAWEDHFFAVVPVDALGGFIPEVNSVGAYVFAKEMTSRELAVFVGEEPVPPLREATSREVSLVVCTTNVPEPVTCLGCGFQVRDAVRAFSALDLDWTAYNDMRQQDVVQYRVYLGPAYFDSVEALSPLMYVPAETKRCTITGLVPYGIYYVAVVAEDALGQTNPALRSQSAQASVDHVGEVRNLTAVCGTNSLTFRWNPPDGASPSTNDLLVSYQLYLAGASTPLVLDRWATTYTATNLLPGHGYPLLITTLDISNRLSDGATLLAATLVPNPSQTVATSFYGVTRVAWEHLEAEEVVERFMVYMAATNFTSIAGLTPVQSTRGHSVDFTNLVSGQTYYFAVTTKNIGGCDSSELPVRVVAHTTGGDTPATTLQPGSYTNGVFSITVSGPIGAEYVLQESENLRDWVPTSTNSALVTPYSLFVTNTEGGNRFYRVMIR